MPLSRQFLGGEDRLLNEDIGERGYPALVIRELADHLGAKRLDAAALLLDSAQPVNNREMVGIGTVSYAKGQVNEES